MAYDSVTEDNVYLCVGHPLRRDIENIVNWMLNDNFTDAYNSILSRQRIVTSRVKISTDCPQWFITSITIITLHKVCYTMFIVDAFIKTILI